MRVFAFFASPPHSNGEVSPSHGDGGIVSLLRAASGPSVANYRATSPFEWGGK